MLTSFVAKGYRNIDAEVSLGRVNVLIGPNNSGKSNFLKALRVLADTLSAPNDNIATVLSSSAHGGPELAPRGTPDPTLTLAWGLGHSVTYSLQLAIPRADRWSAMVPTQSVTDSAIRPGPKGLIARGAEVFAQGVPTRLATEHLVPGSIIRQRDRLGADEWLRADPDWWSRDTRQIEAFGRHFAAYRCSDFRPGEIARAQPNLVSTGRLSESGSDLVHALRFLETSPDGLGALSERLAELIPGLTRVYTGDAATQRWIMLNLKDGPWTLGDMSDGTVQAFALAYLLFTPARMSTLCIDEPELNLHPAWLRVLGGWLQRASSCEQVIVGTHSPDLLDTFTEGFRSGDVAVLVFPGEGRPVRQVKPEDLDPMFAEGWELGDLYRVGEPALGGWPW
jgi:energy-coupling factor transporter ATP-binding protein EcfA2